MNEETKFCLSCGKAFRLRRSTVHIVVKNRLLWGINNLPNHTLKNKRPKFRHRLVSYQRPNSFGTKIG